MPDFLVRVPGLPSHRLSDAHPELRIGRTPDQDIILDDPAISRTHAKLTWKEGRAYLEDLGSRHGSFINGTRLCSCERIRPADAIRVGPISLTLEEAPRLKASQTPPLGEEDTQALPVETVQGWRLPGGRPEALPKGGEALELFYEFSLLLLQDRPSEALMEDMLSRLFAFLDAGHGALLLPESGGQLAPFATRGKQPQAGFSPGLSPALAQAAARREAILLREAAPLDGSGASPGPRVAASSAMAVPLEHAGEVLGLFYFQTRRSRPPFTEDDLRIVASLGNLAAARVLQQRLAGELRQRQAAEQELRAVEAAAQAKGEFLTHLSHEMRTPMNAILGFLHLTLGEELPPLASEYLRKVEHSSRSLLDLLDEVLDLSKIEAKRLELESRPFRIADILQAVTDLLGPLAREKALVLTATRSDAADDWLLGDPSRLRQVLVNLVGNALKFTERGRVEVRAELREMVEGRALFQFSVSDTGLGLTPAQASRLFTPFTQADPSITRRFGGTGLGLAISKRLVELMGGDIWVESSPGEGSDFLFTARFASAPDQAAVADPETPAQPRDCREGLGGLRILLVEDNTISRELASILLRRVGIQVISATQGAEAVALADHEEYDLILMDLEMPGVDGFEATRRIRSSGRNQGCPIVALTAHALAGHRERCLAEGMQACLVKPITPDTFYEALHRWAGGARRPRTSVAPPSEPEPGPSSAGDLECLGAVVDLPLALRRLDGSRFLLLKFLRAFGEDQGELEAIRAALAVGARPRAASLAHGLKGISDTLAITAVAAAARALEAHLREPMEEDWEPVFNRLETALTEFRARVRSLG